MEQCAGKALPMRPASLLLRVNNCVACPGVRYDLRRVRRTMPANWFWPFAGLSTQCAPDALIENYLFLLGSSCEFT